MVAEREFAGIVREHQAMVFGIAWNTLQDSTAAEDIAQDVFLALHENLAKLEGADHVRHWLANVASRRCIDEIRKRRHRAGPALHLVREPGRADHHGDLLLEERLRQTVASLPAAARLLVVLRYQEDLGLAEIAAALGITPEQAKSRLHRAMTVLRERMARHEVTV